ncbi:hypothetical protein [Streptomyces sp. NPDC059656]|uniref:hypothetical protein n=1 Tax=Streptomyces sp. NPDC059656 TaxID=3346898 RepID=UPI00367F0D8E
MPERPAVGVVDEQEQSGAAVGAQVLASGWWQDGARSLHGLHHLPALGSAVVGEAVGQAGLAAAARAVEPPGRKPRIGVVEDADVRDEYDCMLGPLLRMLRGDADQTAIASFLLHDLEDHFGLTPRPSEPEAMAARVLSWWTAAGRAFGGEAVGGAGG